MPCLAYSNSSFAIFPAADFLLVGIYTPKSLYLCFFINTYSMEFILQSLLGFSVDIADFGNSCSDKRKKRSTSAATPTQLVMLGSSTLRDLSVFIPDFIPAALKIPSVCLSHAGANRLLNAASSNLYIFLQN